MGSLCFSSSAMAVSYLAVPNAVQRDKDDVRPVKKWSMRRVNHLSPVQQVKAQERIVLSSFYSANFKNLMRVDQSNYVVQRRQLRDEGLHVLDVVYAVGIASRMRTQNAVM